MLRPRIIPSLLIQDKGLVKTEKFKKPTYLGDPINAVRIFNEKEVDELVVFDIDASTNDSEPDYELIRILARECRMPLAYGGGVKTSEQASRLIQLGVEKVCLSSAVIESPNLITEIANEVGSQSVVVVLDVKKRRFSKKYEIVTHNATKGTGLCPIEFAKKAESLGAGEIVINSVDRDGTFEGFDVQLSVSIRSVINIPMTILGGAGQLSHFEELVNNLGIVGLAAGSFFVFKGSYKAVLISYLPEPDKIKLASLASDFYNSKQKSAN